MFFKVNEKMEAVPQQRLSEVLRSTYRLSCGRLTSLTEILGLPNITSTRAMSSVLGYCSSSWQLWKMLLDSIKKVTSLTARNL